MDEDEAILFLLDLGLGSLNRSKEISEKVTEIQEECGVTECDERELKRRLKESDSVSLNYDLSARTKFR